MRFMILLKSDPATESGILPSAELLTAMGKFNEDLVNAGVLLAGEGLHPSSKGARVLFSGDRRTVVAGPFAESKELLAGFWLIDVKSLDEAVEWVKRVPSDPDTESAIEVRRVFEAADFAPEMTPEMQQAEQHLRERVVTG